MELLNKEKMAIVTRRQHIEVQRQLMISQNGYLFPSSQGK